MGLEVPFSDTTMSQTSQLVDAVKSALRQRGLTYSKLANGLGISQSSVKRMFSQGNLDLERLERICVLMELEIADLLELARAAEKRITQLTAEQEGALAGEPKLMLVAILAHSHWTVPDILKSYRFSEPELVGLLVRLDRLGIIDLLPGNRIKVRLARNFTWRRSGPIQRFFEEHVQPQFFRSSFLGEGELRLIVHGSLSERSRSLLQQRMHRIAQEFDALVEEDRGLDHAMRAGTTIVLAVRPWELSMFAELGRHGDLESRDPVRRARDPVLRYQSKETPQDS